MSAEVPAERVAVTEDYRFSPDDVAAAFSGQEQEFSYWDQRARFKVVELDAVVITSGVVVPGDPAFGSLAALQRRIPPGVYPVSLALVQLASGDERIAFARMLLSPAPVATWEVGWHEAELQPVVRDGQRQYVPQEYAFYYSHAGAGCFMDAAAIPALWNLDVEARVDMINDALEDNLRSTWSCFSFKPDSSRDENIVCYLTEPGGRHSHFGLDAHGNAAVIVTNFRMF
jgi:Protein of unknown function (DUF4241)